MMEIKERVCYWRSTVIGLAVLAFVAYAVRLDPKLLNSPTSIIAIAAGLFAIFAKA